jgi:hypothetical protein
VPIVPINVPTLDSKESYLVKYPNGIKAPYPVNVVPAASTASVVPTTSLSLAPTAIPSFNFVDSNDTVPGEDNNMRYYNVHTLYTTAFVSAIFGGVIGVALTLAINKSRGAPRYMPLQ